MPPKRPRRAHRHHLPVLVGLLACLWSSATASPTFGEPNHALEPEVPTAWDAGTLWSHAPPIAPGSVLRGPTPEIDDLRRAMTLGDTRRARHIAERIVQEVQWGNDRTVAAFTLGLIYREEELFNLASEAFTQVRISSSPLAEWGAYYEAEQDLRRGKPWVAVRECEQLEKRWPRGRFSLACQRLTARALVAAGSTTRAQQVAAAYDRQAAVDPISEQIDLAIARRWTTHHPDLAIPLLQRLAVHHQAPLTGRVAEGLLAQLRHDGHADATVPDDTASLQRRAVSLRDAKRKDMAFDLFQTLVERSADDPALAEWVASQAPRFYWRTHRWDDLAAHYERVHHAQPSGDTAWDWYRALDRGGRFGESLAVAQAAQQAHGRSARWRRSHETIARTAMLAGDYSAAREQFDVVVARGGWAGRRARLYGGIAAHLDGDHPDAVDRLTPLIDQNRGYLPNARYWRAKAHEATGRPELARRDADWILRHAPRDWYAVLLRHRSTAPRGPMLERRGRWPTAPPPQIPEVPHHPLIAQVVPTGAVATPRRAQGLDLFGSLTWPLRASAHLPPTLRELPVSLAMYDPTVPPSSYRRSPLMDPESSLRSLASMARTHGRDWPEWQLTYDFARAGLYDISGPLLSSLYETWKVAVRSPRHRHHAVARRISGRGQVWRPLFYAARDHHHTDRFTFGLWDKVDDPTLKDEALRLGWPLAHDHYVWQHARRNDVDPFLVMAIMRVESRYDAVAVSRVGARGAMQIMPRTGALLADLQHDESFLAGDLEDPVFAVGFGIDYLGQLLDRFDGAYPLAVASYNGGPFNVSAWLAGGGDLPIDAFVEHIPFQIGRAHV